MRASIAPFLSALFLLAACGGVAAQVRQCEAADGSTIYTDKGCAALGAEQVRVPSVPLSGLPRYRSGCVRDLQEFIYAVSSAIEVNDVNRLAALYRWKGTSSSASRSLMRRLETIAARPLLQVVPVYPEAPADDFYAPIPPSGQPPVGLRLDQTLANGTTPADTTLGLRRDLGCWWVTL